MYNPLGLLSLINDSGRGGEFLYRAFWDVKLTSLRCQTTKQLHVQLAPVGEETSD